MINPKHIHFIGICGSGMAPLAELAFHQKYRVTGSDVSDSNEFERLSNLGIKIYKEHNAKNIDGADSVVYSSAIKESNLELKFGIESELNIFHRSDFLNFLMTGKKNITVAGTHGKTTTAAMITHMLHEMGESPTSAVGGIMASHNSPCLLGDSNLFVAETDESDGTFRKYDPYIGVITNIGLDHMDFYRDEVAIEESFLEYAMKIDLDGFAILGWDNPACRRLGQILKEKSKLNFLSFGFVLGCDIRCIESKPYDAGMYFKAVVERDLVECNIPTFGKVNILNALAALSVARALELDVVDAAKSLETFGGVKRRLDVLLTNENFTLADDYAHNPDKIAASISALKGARPDNHLVTIFQPHRYTRFTSMKIQFASCFKECDEVVVLPVYAAGEDLQKGCTSVEISALIEEESKTKSVGFNNFEDCFSYIMGSVKEKTTILTVGAGDVWQVAENLKKGLSSWEEKKAPIR